MRDWCAILIDAGLRDIRASDVAKEQNVSITTASTQAKRYGLLLNGASGSNQPRESKHRYLRLGDWAQEFRFAAETNEPFNQFCARVRVCAQAAKEAAATNGHTWPSMAERKLQWWRRELALAEAAGETLNAFCARTSKSGKSATAWAARLSHTFTASSKRSAIAKGPSKADGRPGAPDGSPHPPKRSVT